MPAEADLAVCGKGCILRCLIICHRCFHLLRDLTQAFIFHISDDCIRCLYLTPGLHLFQYLKGISLDCLCQDRALYAASQPDCGILFQLCYLPGSPFGIDLYMSVITFIGIIRKQFYIVSCHIYVISVREADHITGFLCSFRCRICSLSECCPDHFCRSSI